MHSLELVSIFALRKCFDTTFIGFLRTPLFQIDHPIVEGAGYALVEHDAL
jgi:hypothetical protein